MSLGALVGKRAVLAEAGTARLPILVRTATAAAAELERYFERISGADFEVLRAARNQSSIYVGTGVEFPWLALDDTSDLGEEDFLLRSDGKNLLLIGHEPLGAQHAVTTLLHRLGCRWFFPRPVWEVIPERETIAGSWSERQAPSFRTQRRIWYGYGAYPRQRAELAEWARRNRMGGPIAVIIGHTWHELEPKTDFAEHPDWFALVDGQRQASKPCYSHPEVIARACEFATSFCACACKKPRAPETKSASRAPSAPRPFSVAV